MRSAREHLGQSGTRSRLRSRISLAQPRPGGTRRSQFKRRHLECILQQPTIPLAERTAALAPAIELVRRVVAQTRARILHGDTHYPGKMVSVFEPHTEIIRKGKLARPTEFGRVVKIQEAEAQFITDYTVVDRGQPDRALWEPALDRHIALFDRAPELAVADGGFASRSNERAAQERGVRHVVLPRQAREKRSRIAHAVLRWRTGSEGRVSALKRRHGSAAVSVPR